LTDDQGYGEVGYNGNLNLFQGGEKMKAQYVTRRGFLKNTGHGVMAAAFWDLTSLASAAFRKPNKPNIILVLTDDQGWTDTSVQMMKRRSDSKGKTYHTPNLERLAKQGMIFSNGYSPSPVCSPSRDSILYGKTPTRLHHSILLGKANCGPDALTTPRVIKNADPTYVTAHFGKWACSPPEPESAGFDISDGKTNNWHGDWRRVNGEKIRLPQDDPKRIFSVTKRAISFMEDQVKAGRPFYMRISHYAVHVGYFALEETIEKYRRAGHDESTAVYAAMMENLDSGLGQLLDKIDQLNISDNTYVIYTSDNGGGYRGNGPLKGGKASLWEGGIRVPTVVRGPGIKAGSYCDIPIVGWDFLPTFADLAGNRKPLPDDLDGGNLRPLFENGNKGKVNRRTEPLIFHYPWFDSLPMSTIRVGDYKLVKDINTNETQLYNLAKDIGETTDLSKSMPAKAKKMHEQLTAYLEEVNAEKIEDLRAGRRKQLNLGIERDEEDIRKLQERMKETAGEKEKQSLQKEIDMRKRRIAGNKAALDRVEKSLHMRAW